MKFLHEMKEYVEAHSATDFKVIINNSLKKTASDWWHIVRNGIDTFEEFESKFKASYWSEAIQDKYNNKLLFARYNYNSDSSLTCVQYATHMAAIATDLGYNEKDTVTKVSKLFSFSIKSAIRGSQNKSLSYLLELLHEADNDIKLRKIKEGKNKSPNQSNKNDKKVEFCGNSNNKNNNNHNKNNGSNKNNNNSPKRHEIQAIAEIHKVNDDDEILQVEQENE